MLPNWRTMIARKSVPSSALPARSALKVRQMPRNPKCPRDPAAADNPEDARQAQPWERQAAKQVEPALVADQVHSLYRCSLEPKQEIAEKYEAEHAVNDEDDIGDRVAERCENQERY